MQQRLTSAVTRFGKRQELGVQVWQEVRGGDLDEGSLQHMLTYAAEASGSRHLTFPAFMELVAALNAS